MMIYSLWSFHLVVIILEQLGCITTSTFTSNTTERCGNVRCN